MPNPICPDHGVEMLPSKFTEGDFYCGKKVGGKFCKQKRRGGGSPSMTSAGEALKKSGWVPTREVEPVAQEPSTTPAYAKTWNQSDARVAAALNFAGRIYQGAGADPGTMTADVEKLALNLAERALLMFERKP